MGAQKDPRIIKLQDTDTMLQILDASGKSASQFRKGQTMYVWNKMEKSYSYILSAPMGKEFDPEFQPELTPDQILRLGAFEGKYLNDCLLEFPMEWFVDAIALDKLRPHEPDVNVNCFQSKSRQPLDMWAENGWLPSSKKAKGQYPPLGDPEQNPDERGWFQWYCRYYMGRRIPAIDQIQIARWKAFRRHAGAIKKNCRSGDVTCRPRQRQALLQWAYNPFI
jgi:hypothetical protein